MAFCALDSQRRGQSGAALNMTSAPEDESFMQLAEAEAEAALRIGEVPVGCVIVRAGDVVARSACVRACMRACACACCVSVCACAFCL